MSSSHLFIIWSSVTLAIISAQEFEYDLTQDTSNWIDPGDMFSYDHLEKKNIKSDTSPHIPSEDMKLCDCSGATSSRGSESNCDPVLDKLDICRKEHKILSDLTKTSSCNQRIVAFVNRSVRKFVMKLKNFEEELVNEEMIEISTEIDPKKIEIINQFSSQSNPDCKRVDEFEEVFYELIDNIYLISRSDQNWFMKVYHNYGFIFGLIVASFASLLFLYKFYKMPIYAKLTTIYILVLLISFVWQWLQLYQIEISKKHHKMSSAPINCLEMKNENAFTFSSIFFSYIKTVDKDCQEYYRALMVNPVFEVNPLTACSQALSGALFSPITTFFDKLGEGFASFYSHFTFIEKFLMSIVLLIASIIALIFLMGYSIHLPFFLGSITRGPRLPAVSRCLQNQIFEPQRLSINHLKARDETKVCDSLQIRRRSPNQTTVLSRSRSLPSLV